MTGLSNLPHFAKGVFSEDEGRIELLGSRCPRCERLDFPALDQCPQDAEMTDMIGLGGRATLYSHTVIRTKPPFGLPTPYAVGYADLEGSGLRVFMLLDPAHAEEFEIGMKLTLAAGELGVDLAGNPCRRPFFTPSRSGD